MRMRFIPTSFTILLILSALAASVVAQPLPMFELTKEWKAKIEAIAPERPLAEPGEKRLALVFNLITGYHHWCTPHMTEVVRILGEKSGAYDVVVSDDITHFEKENIGKFDAIILINNCSKNPSRNLFYDKLGDMDKANELEANLIDHVAKGNGLVGFHGAILMQNKSEAFSETMGGSFHYHPKQTRVIGKVLEKDHPISSAFKGDDLVHIDEPYCFNGAYSKINFRPLLEMELPDFTPEEQTKLFGRSEKNIARYISWIKPHGEGRVFYCSPSHNAQSFENPKLLQFMLNGIQYALGDLECDDSVLGVEAPDDPVADPKSNVLFIAVDDLNDWIGVLGGHPQAKTPHMDRLASRGVLFSNAHCQSPVCNPSRASLMTSLYPSTSGIYFLNPDIRESPVASKSLVIPRRFEKEGYNVFAAGKLFHNARGINEYHVPNYAGQFGHYGPLPKKKISRFPGMRLWDWGVYPAHDDQMPDHKIASWAEERLAETQEQPFWMGVGFYRPHVPQFAPQKWFDMYPIESVQLPKVISDDLSDISSYGVDISRLKHIAPTHEWVMGNEQWKPLVQSYLACVSFVDAQIGRVIKALDEGAYGENTYVVLFSDHGFHLGEKERFAKRSLWEDGTRVPLIIVGPNIPAGKVCAKPVQLLDIYPTLLALTNLEADPRHEGHSLVPLLKDVEADWPYMARSNFGPGNYAILSEHCRFIQYNDGSEEFYDHSKDPQEWHNVIDHAEYESIIKKHRAQIPQERHEILGRDSYGHKSYSATEENANARGR